MGQKSPKDSVGITNADGRIRLRWKYQDKRYSMSLLAYSKTNLLQARKLALQIEQDMITDVFDTTLIKYSEKNTQSSSSPGKSFVMDIWITNGISALCKTTFSV
jgi:integrase